MSCEAAWSVLEQDPCPAHKLDIFYLRPLPNVPEDPTKTWFVAAPIGENKRGKMVKDMFTEVGIAGKIKNHWCYRTLHCKCTRKKWFSNVPGIDHWRLCVPMSEQQSKNWLYLKSWHPIKRLIILYLYPVSILRWEPQQHKYQINNLQLSSLAIWLLTTCLSNCVRYPKASPEVCSQSCISFWQYYQLCYQCQLRTVFYFCQISWQGRFWLSASRGNGEGSVKYWLQFLIFFCVCA